MAGRRDVLEVVRLGGDPVQVELLPAVGGRLHRLRAFGHDLLRTPAAPASHVADPYFWGGYPMAPWCNRIAAGRVRVGGRTVDLAASFPDGTAIHGQVPVLPWLRRDDGVFAVKGGDDGWPWSYEVVERVSVSGPLIRIGLAITNLAADPMPAGLGLHPWFVGPLEVAVAGSRVVRSNSDPGLPVEGVDGAFDLRAVGPVPDGLDATWLDVDDPAVELRWPGLDLAATLRCVPGSGVCVALASPAGLGAIAVEPQTHAPWGLRRYLAGDPGGLRRLEPGESLELSVEIEVRRTA